MIFAEGRPQIPPEEFESDTITTTHGTLTRQQLHALNERERNAPPTAPDKAPPARYCPRKTGFDRRCTRDACAWFDGEKCAQVCPHPATDRKCPIDNTACTADCAMRAE